VNDCDESVAVLPNVEKYVSLHIVGIFELPLPFALLFLGGLASNLYALGVQPHVIQSVLRRASMSVTMDFYVKAEQDAARTALKPLTDLFYPLG
jgi:hypothetical protein